MTNHPGDIVIFEAGPWYASNSDGFLADCGRQLDNWAIGRAVIPSRLVIPLHKKGVYRLAIDVRAGAPRGPLSGEVTSVDHLPVRCAMVARLTALGDGLRIDGDANWTMRRFSTPGTVEWAWTILANEAGHTQVRLEIRPVILQALPNGEVVAVNEDGRINIETYTSELAVSSGLLDAADKWFHDDFPKIAGIAALLGGAAISVLNWLRKLLSLSR